MSIDRKLLELLRCPVTKRPLRIMDAQRVDALNERITRGTVQYLNGTVLTEPLQGVLVTDTGTTAYRINNGCPVMLADESIALDTLGDENGSPP